MNFKASFTVPRHRVSAGLLILALCCTSAAIAGNTFSGASPGGNLDDSAPSLPDEKNDLTLRNAARIALLRNPELAAFAKEIRALKGVTLQAGLLPNPDLIIMAENAGNLQKVNNAPGATIKEVEQQDTTIRINQLIELGGKRAARVKAASLGEERAAF